MPTKTSPTRCKPWRSIAYVQPRRFGAWAGAMALWLSAAGAAQAAAPLVLDDGDYTNTLGVLNAQWTFDDPDDDVVGYDYQISRAAPDGPVVRIWTSLALDTTVSATDLSLFTGESYFFQVRARYAQGVSETGSSDGIVFDATRPVIAAVLDDGEYQTQDESLHVRWSASDIGTGISHYRYAVGTRPRMDDVVPWTDVGLVSEVTAQGLSLLTPGYYLVTVQAYDFAGNITTAVSDGISVDAIPPVFLSLYTGGPFASSDQMLSASWRASDRGFGIAGYEYQVTSAGASDPLVPWTDNGLARSVTVSGLSLQEGQVYFVLVRVRDQAGNATVLSSAGTRVDMTAPVITSIFDGGDFQADAQTLGASWLGNDGTGSGLAGYSYAVGTTPGASDVIEWNDVGLQNEIALDGLNLQNAQRYFFAVRASDNLGFSSTSLSDGIMVDIGGPSIASIVDGGEYTSLPDSLSFQYTAFDGESGISEYRYAVGTTMAPESIVPWTSAGTTTMQTLVGLPLAENEFYIIGINARDGAGNTATDYSDGIRTDFTAPQVSAFRDDGEVTARTDRLGFSWEASDAVSGIVSYSYSIGSAPGLADIRDWTPVGTQTQVLADGLALLGDTTYFASLRANDAAGNQALVHTDGIRVDTAPPLVSNIMIDSITGQTATIRWQTNKPVGSQLQYGPTAEYGQLAVSQGLSQEHARIIGGLSPATEYHFRITVTDDAGMSSSTEDRVFSTLDEATRHAQMNPPGTSYIDPETLQNQALVTFRTGNGDVWVGDLDPATGLFASGDGRDRLIDTASETGTGINGPEFGLDSDGWAVFYSKTLEDEVQIWRASEQAGEVIAEPLTVGGRHQTALPTQNSSRASARVVNILGSWETGGDIAWFDEQSPDIQHVFATADGAGTNRNPGRWTDDGHTLVMVDDVTGQLFLLDTDTGVVQSITDDAGFKTAPHAWAAPEYGGQRVVTAVLDDTQIGVYLDLGDPYWQRIATLSIPVESANGVFSSPEPFVAAGKSYLVVNIKDVSTGQGDFTDGEIWVLDLEPDAHGRYAQRCDDGSTPLRRSDPEVFVGSSDVFVYYSAQAVQGETQMWQCRTGIDVQNVRPVVQTLTGAVQGVRSARANAHGFLGIPYADAPVDELRFAPPQPVPAWARVRAAARFSLPCPQPDRDLPDNSIAGVEDCLFLNVWRPDNAPAGQMLPVLFFVHGGANRTGAASTSLSKLLSLETSTAVSDGARLSAAANAVVVTSNYRLAALGNLAFDPGSNANQYPGMQTGNYGLRDLIAALQWVQQNITGFSGDPTRVTLAGQSAGAHNVAALLTSPAASGLFAGAIMHSGATGVDTLAQAQADASAFVAEMGLGNSDDLLADLRSLPVEDVVLAEIARPLGFADFTFYPHVDGELLTGQPLDVILQRQHNDVPIVIGSLADEYAHDFENISETEFFDLAAALVPAEHLDQLHLLYPLTAYLSPTHAYVAMLTDRNLTSTTRTIARVASTQASPVYRYYFSQVLSTPARAADGAYHGSDLLYLFAHMDGAQFSADADDRQVETLMLNYWGRFVSSGDPNGVGDPAWSPYEPAQDNYLHIAPSVTTGVGLRTETSDFWDLVSATN